MTLSKLANISLLISCVLFIAFFLNVLWGALGNKAPLNDVQEMLTLFVAAIIFAISVLQLEALDKNQK